MSRRPAPPGRKASVKREAFKADETIGKIDPVKLDTTVSSKASEIQADGDAAKIERERLEKQEATRKEAEQAAKEAERLKEEELVRENERQRKETETSEKKATEDKMEAERKRLEDEEKVKKEAELAAEKEQQMLEKVRKEKELFEKQRQLEEEQRLKDDKQRQLEERQRLMDEKLAQQRLADAEKKEKEQLLEAAKLKEQELEAKRKQQEVEAQLAAEQQEIQRLREEEEARQLVRRQEALKQEQAEKAAQDEELKALEAERAKAAEQTAQAEQAMADYEAAALEEKRKRAEEQRKKRAMFLNDMDTFSSDFQSKTQLQDEQVRKDQEQHAEMLAEQMKKVEEVKAQAAAREKAEREAAAIAAAAGNTTASSTSSSSSSSSSSSTSAVAAADNGLPSPPLKEEKSEEYAIKLGANNENAEIDGLSSSLFAAAPAAAAAVSTVSTGGAAVAEQQQQPSMEEEELRMPTRIGSGKPKSKSSSKAIDTLVKATGKQSKTEDEEEEGTGELSSISNILTLEERRGMTAEQKETWRAKQMDLTHHRKDFHGVVTLCFDGVFSWQMYGSAEAVDENGSSYTEYLMRCQWGSGFDDMQPWIVAHRYKEFDFLDQQLKKKFPNLEPNMPKLPKKELFRSLESAVVATRRAALEEYMSKIVVSMPSILRSELLNDFLDITNRISTIRRKAAAAQKEDSASATAVADAGAADAGTAGTAGAGTVDAKDKKKKSKVPGVTGNSKYGIDDPLAARASSAAAAGDSSANAGAGASAALAEDGAEPPLLWTLDQAEKARESQNARAMDEDELGYMELDVRALLQIFAKGDQKSILQADSKFRSKFRTISRRWPNLRATAVVGMDVDFTLIPRAMQVEEDLLRVINEFRGMETAHAVSHGPL